jgi:hypothetical protein
MQESQIYPDAPATRRFTVSASLPQNEQRSRRLNEIRRHPDAKRTDTLRMAAL